MEMMKGISYADMALKLLLVHMICITPFICSATSLSRAKDRKMGFRVDLRRIDDEESLSKRLQNAVERSKLRAQYIAMLINQASLNPTASFESPVRLGRGEFLMQVGVGTPTVTFNAVVDTGSDLIWTQCLPCKSCYNQSTPIFDPSKSSTYSTISCGNTLCDALASARSGCNPDCGYQYAYGDGSNTTGDLSYETLTIGRRTTVPRIAFGCGHNNQGEGFTQGGGLVGLAKGALSLISQLGDKVDNKFSYCLLPITEDPSKTSPMIFGDTADLRGRSVETISFITNEIYPSFYYLPVTGITVGGSALTIPKGSFDIGNDGTGGMIIDSGTTLTYLPAKVYKLLKDAVQSAVKLSPSDGSSVGLDLCYHASTGDLDAAKVTFNFKGGVDLELPIENTFADAGNGLLCLAMLGDSESFGSSILGNIQQQNFHIVYDNAANKLSFQPAQCNSL